MALMDRKTHTDKRLELPAILPLRGSGILSVLLSPDEDVEWHYCVGENGTDMVATGYTIHKKPTRKN